MKNLFEFFNYNLYKSIKMTKIYITDDFNLSKDEQEIFEDLKEFDRLKKKLLEVANKKSIILNGKVSAYGKIIDVKVKKNNEVCFYDKHGKTNLDLEDFLTEKFMFKYHINRKRDEFYSNPEFKKLLDKAEEKRWEKLEKEQFEKNKDIIDDFLSLEF